MSEIKSVAVIGAGVMGAAIAAHVANAGVKVKLLDIVKPGSADRNAIAKAAIERFKKAQPNPLMSSAAAKLITPGNTEDDFDSLAECDWIVEAVIERLDIKQALYARLARVRKPTRFHDYPFFQPAALYAPVRVGHQLSQHARCSAQTATILRCYLGQVRYHL
jgi:3-hydroxyacyl-CoA dehydrogenase